MKNGFIWEEIIGQYDGFRKVKGNDNTNLDIISHSKKVIIELKNRTNTDNTSSRKSKLDTLSYYKTLHPDYTCIYGCVNEHSAEKTFRGSKTLILHKGMEIQHLTGRVFLDVVLGDHNCICKKFN